MTVSTTASLYCMVVIYSCLGFIQRGGTAQGTSLHLRFYAHPPTSGIQHNNNVQHHYRLNVLQMIPMNVVLKYVQNFIKVYKTVAGALTHARSLCMHLLPPPLPGKKPCMKEQSTLSWFHYSEAHVNSTGCIVHMCICLSTYREFQTHFC